MSLWSLPPAPLMAGADLPDNDPWTRALLTNPEVLAIDQDSSDTGAAAAPHQGNTEVGAKPLADGSLAVGLFNRGDLDGPVVASWTDLRVTGRCHVRNLWQRKSSRRFRPGILRHRPPSQGAILLRLQHQGGPGRIG